MFFHRKRAADNTRIAIRQRLFEPLFVEGIHMVTKPGNNMKNWLLHLREKILLLKRFLIETVNDQL